MLPPLPVRDLGRTEISTIGVHLLTVFGRPVFDLGLMPVELGVEVDEFLASWHESDGGELFACDAFRVRGGDLSEGCCDVVEMSDGDPSSQLLFVRPDGVALQRRSNKSARIMSVGRTYLRKFMTHPNSNQ